MHLLHSLLRHVHHLPLLKLLAVAFVIGVLVLAVIVKVIVSRRP